MYDHDFLIASRVFRLSLEHRLRITAGFEPFLVRGCEPDCCVSFREVGQLALPGGDPLFKNVSFTAYAEGDGFVRVFHEHKDADRVYATGRVSPDGREVTVEYLPGNTESFSETHNSFSHIAVERLLISHRRFILHAALVSTPWGGVLFSGPSGIGKSTQAQLWAEHEGCEVINGDRVILAEEDGVLYGWGSPYAGSSGYHVSKRLPIAAAVILSQGSENHAERMTPLAAFRALYSQTTVNTWDPGFVAAASELAASAAVCVPVLDFACTPDRRAVEALGAALDDKEIMA